MHKYERFVRNLDHTSISKFWVLCSKVCMKFWFTYFFQTTYLFDRIQTILESVFFQESRTFSSQDSGVGLIVWRLRRYEFYEECRLLDGDTLTAFSSPVWGSISDIALTCEGAKSDRGRIQVWHIMTNPARFAVKSNHWNQQIKQWLWKRFQHEECKRNMAGQSN